MLTRRNILCARNVAPKLLSDQDARSMERKMRKNSSVTPKKQSEEVINKTVSEWTAFRALHRVGLVSAIRKKKPVLSNKTIKARLVSERSNTPLK